jgi:hypothetical protein
MLILMPIADVLFGELQALQLVSSRFGVAMLRRRRERVSRGNIIDLDHEAPGGGGCSNLRYLFSLVALGVVAACFFGRRWQRLCARRVHPAHPVLMNTSGSRLSGSRGTLRPEAAQACARSRAVVFMGSVIHRSDVTMALSAGCKTFINVAGAEDAAAESRIR